MIEGVGVRRLCDVFAFLLLAPDACEDADLREPCADLEDVDLVLLKEELRLRGAGLEL